MGPFSFNWFPDAGQPNQFENDSAWALGHFTNPVHRYKNGTPPFGGHTTKNLRFV